MWRQPTGLRFWPYRGPVHTRTPRLLTALTATLLAATACASSTTARAATVSAHVPAAAPRVAAHPSKILVVIEENHSRAEMQAQMPYLARLSATYGYATNWHALTHPSEPNYLAIAGGSMFGVTDDHTPAANAPKLGNARSVFGQARAAGKSVATFAQSMPAPCTLSNSGAYAVRHNPWAYFGAERSACRRGDVSTATFASRARHNTLPNLGFLIPDVNHDAHDGTLATADAWLKGRLRPVLASRDFTSGKLVVVVTADEDDRLSGNVVLTSVLAAKLHHKVVRTRLDHYSLTRYIAQVLGVTPLRSGRTAPNMKAAFGL